MTFLPGTHLDQLPHTENKSNDANMLAFGQTIEPELLDKFQEAHVTAALEAGEFSVHHFRLAHKSGPNASNDRRIGFAIRYIATSVRRAGNTKELATLVRGVDNYGHFDHEPAPQGDLQEAMAEVHADAMRRENANYYASRQ